MINEQKTFDSWYKVHIIELAYTDHYNAVRLAWEERARHDTQDEEATALKKERHNWKKETAIANLKRVLADKKNKELKEALQAMVKTHLKHFGLDGAWDEELLNALAVLEETPR